VSVPSSEELSSDKRDISFSRSLALGLVLAVVMLVGAVVFTAKWISVRHDSLAASSSNLMVSSALDALANRNAAFNADYAHWDEHHDQLLEGDWTWLCENVGVAAVEGTAIELVAYIPPGHDRNLGWSYLHQDEAPKVGIIGQELASSMIAILPATPTRRDVVTSFEEIDGQIWLLALTRITPFDGISAEIPDLDIWLFINGTRLTETVLSDLESSFLLQGIDLSMDAPKYASFLPLQSSAGKTVGYLSWVPPTPGAQVLRELPLPVFGAILLVIAFLLIGSMAIYKNARRLETALTDTLKANRHKDEFISTISHELRTPLTSVSASVNLLLLGVVGQLPAKAVSILEICGRNARVLTALIEDLLLIGMIDSGRFSLNKSPTEMNALLRVAVEDFKAYAASQKVSVEVSLEEGRVFANIDPRRFNQVITNILSNAVKFSPVGSVVRAEIKSDDQKVRLLFMDKGIGIPADRKEDVFGRFRQIDTRDEKKHYGSGLGMCIAKDIMKASGGTIDYESELGVGTCFFIEVDRCAAPSEAQGEGSVRVFSRLVA
jgi:signal transduction histidine kinase